MTRFASQTFDTPSTAPRQGPGVGDDIRSRFSAALSPTRPGVSAMAKTALPFLAMAARRAPVGLALVGAAALGVALANPRTRTKILDAGRRGLEAIRR